MKCSNWFIFVQRTAVSNSDYIGNGTGYGLYGLYPVSYNIEGRQRKGHLERLLESLPA